MRIRRLLHYSENTGLLLRIVLTGCMVVILNVHVIQAQEARDDDMAGVWLFLPTYGQQIVGIQREKADSLVVGKQPMVIKTALAAGKRWDEKQLENVRWHAADFPHQNFVKLMPQRNVFGWYALPFDVPTDFLDHDLIVDLGVIDDADETYLNGRLAGKTGKVPNGSVWQKDRSYRISREWLKEKDNVLSCHVWSLWGLGGMTCKPILKIALTPVEAHWQVRYLKQEGEIKTGMNQLDTEDELVASLTRGIEETESSEPIPYNNYKQSSPWPKECQWAIFRTVFQCDTVSVINQTQECVLDIGPVFDVAAVFLNGQKIGVTGRFPDGIHEAFTEGGKRGQYLLPPRMFKEGENSLCVVIYSERGMSGVLGTPGILLTDSQYDRFEVLMQSKRLDDAELFLQSQRPETDDGNVKRLSDLACCAWLKIFDNADLKKQSRIVLDSIRQCIMGYPELSPKQSGMQAFCQLLRYADTDSELLTIVREYFPAYATTCFSLSPDRLTQGDWIPYYGLGGYVLASMGQVMDWRGGLIPFTYKLRLPVQNDVPRHWLAPENREVATREALLRNDFFIDMFMEKGTFSDNEPFRNGHLWPKEKIRRASWWDDHGEMHPFDDKGPDFILDVSIPEGDKMVSLYLLDYDWRRTWHPRQQSVCVFSDSGELLNAQFLGKLDDGVYARFYLDKSFSGKFSFRVNKHHGACTAISGLFVDSTPNLPSLKKAVVPENAPPWEASRIRKQSIDLPGLLPDEIDTWYEELRAASGAERIRIAQKYVSYEKTLLSGECGLRGLFVHIAAASAAFDSPSAIRRAVPPLDWSFMARKAPLLMVECDKIKDLPLCWQYMWNFAYLKAMPADMESEKVAKGVIRMACGSMVMNSALSLTSNNLPLKCYPIYYESIRTLKQHQVPEDNVDYRQLLFFVERAFGKRIYKGKMTQFSLDFIK